MANVFPHCLEETFIVRHYRYPGLVNPPDLFAAFPIA